MKKNEKKSVDMRGESGHMTDGPTNQPTHQHQANQPTNQPANQPASQPDNQPTNQPMSQPTSYRLQNCSGASLATISATRPLQLVVNAMIAREAPERWQSLRW